MRRLIGVSLLALVACGPRDLDGDGFTDDVDCDDANDRVFPGAVESCNGRDEDCDGSIDEAATDATNFYVDQDGDGFGQGSAFIACEAPGEAWALVRGDCDDRAADVFPDATESCDQRDEDCDGEVDEDFVCGELQCDDGIDNDGDGATDCLDEDCDGSCPEVCDDGRDNNGDGATDCADEACWGEASCVELDCLDGGDDEADGLTDCEDPDCWGENHCPSALWRITEGTLSVSRDTTSWTERGCTGPGCDRGVDRLQEVQAYDIRGELVRDVDGTEVTCGFAYDRGRFFSAFEAGSPSDIQVRREAFSIEPGCGIEDARFLPRRLVRTGDEVQTLEGQPWFIGDAFQETVRESDLEDPDRVGRVVRDLVFWDPLRSAPPLGRCASGPAFVRYDDLDGDGVGADGNGGISCQPDGLASAGDCADGDDVRPGPVEICGNGVDDDCDGSAPECIGPGGVSSLDDADAQWEVPAGAGVPRVFDVGDLDGDGIVELAVGLPGDDARQTDAGSVRLWWDGMADGHLDEGTAVHGGAAGDVFGAAVVRIGDKDDPDPSLLITAPGVVVEGTTRSGAAYVFADPVTARGIEDATASIREPGIWLGTTAAFLGDADGDDAYDLAIGAQTEGSGGTNAGAVLVFNAPFIGELDASDADFLLVGQRNDILGDAVAGPGDVDGDGIDDLFVGRRKADTPASEAGAAHLWLGPFPAVGEPDEADATWTGSLADAWAGERVAAAGDLDDDGYRDLLVAAPRTYGVAPRTIAATGEIYVISGSAEPAGGALADATAVIRGDRVYDFAGVAISGGRDVDGDGLDDFIVGAPGDDRGGPEGGVIAVFTEPVSGRLRLGDATGVYRGRAETQAGTWVSLMGDLDGDGGVDWVTGGVDPDDLSRGRVFGVVGGPGW